jgi:CubicO group peptidase (beta-lactamase class C family)
LTAAAAFGTAGILERRSARAQDVVVSGSPQPKYAEFDNVTVQFMVDNAITAGQLAFGRGGKVVFSHAYGAASLAMRVHTTSIFRVASVSKAFTAAALWTLQRKGAFTMDTPLFPYLGIRSVLLPSQKPDSRIDRITIGQAAAHTAGLAPSGEGDPEFEYRKIENAIDASGPLTQLQFARYIYGLPLASGPGKTYAYSNIGYFLLGRVIEKASGMPYMQYLQTILPPLGISDVVLSATDIAGRRPNEATYDADGNGLSVLAPRTQQRLPLPYGGATYWETFDACSDLATSASSLVTFLGTYAAWGVGPRAPRSARAGAMPGTESVVRNRDDGIDFAFIFNKRPDADPFDTAYRRKIEALLDRGV